jgi:predicted ester cyclase
MSTTENKALMRRFVEQGIILANMAIFDELVAEHVIDHFAPSGSPGGRERWKQSRLGFQAAFPDACWEIADMVAEGDLVVVRAPFNGTHQGELFGIPATGRQVSIGSIYICRIVDGQIVERWGNSDDVGMLRQIGAIPAMA